MRRPNIVLWVITAVIILLIGFIWIVTIQDGKRILSRGKAGYRNTEPVPYYSQEHGEDADSNP
jgi:hypothetical protein